MEADAMLNRGKCDDNNGVILLREKRKFYSERENNFVTKSGEARVGEEGGTL